MSDVTAVREVLDGVGRGDLAGGLLRHAVPWTTRSVAPQHCGLHWLAVCGLMTADGLWLRAHVPLCSSDQVRPQDVVRWEATLFVMNKIDLLPSPDTCPVRHSTPNVCWLSCKTGRGVDEFMAALKERAAEMCVLTAVTCHMIVT